MPRQRAAVGARAEGVVDLVHARLARGLHREVDDRAGRHRGAHREAVQLALELRDHEPDRLGGAGRGRDEVDRRRAGAPQVLVRGVLEPLVGRVGVDRRHQAALDADRLVQHLGHRRQAVGRARRVGDDVVVVGVVDVVEVDAERDGGVRLGGRRGDDHLLGARVEVLGGVLALGEEARRLDHDLGAEIAPRQRRRILLGEHLDLAPVDRERAVAHLDGARERPVDRVVLEQVRERPRVGDVVDRDDLDVRVGLLRGAEHVAADAAEAVDPDPYGHG